MEKKELLEIKHALENQLEDYANTGIIDEYHKRKKELSDVEAEYKRFESKLMRFKTSRQDKLFDKKSKTILLLTIPAIAVSRFYGGLFLGLVASSVAISKLNSDKNQEQSLLREKQELEQRISKKRESLNEILSDYYETDRQMTNIRKQIRRIDFRIKSANTPAFQILNCESNHEIKDYSRNGRSLHL